MTIINKSGKIIGVDGRARQASFPTATKPTGFWRCSPKTPT